MAKRLFTSESVTEGHPDKVCDQISDSILDNILAQDPNARVACEVCVTTGMVLVMGEITTECYVDIPKVVRERIKDIGYTQSDIGFDYDTCAVLTSIDEQSGDIAMGVDNSLEHRQDEVHTLGAGDQGMMIGYACDETPELMPYPISMAHKLTMQLTKVRKDGTLKYLRPDGKSQVTVEYDGDKPVRVDTVVISTQHDADVSLETITEDIKREVIEKVLDNNMMDEKTKVYVNPTGRFVVGGPKGDSGLTGRKIIVDTYGGYASHGGGAFSGKDPTKVDRSGAYMARYMAKNIVAAGLARRCEIELAYAIGVAQPVSVYVNCDGTNVVSEEKLVDIILENFDLTPEGIINSLDLRRPIYTDVASYGHFGREDVKVPWENTDKASVLKKYIK